MRDCRACGGSRSGEIRTGQSHAGLCSTCFASCRVCGGERSAFSRGRYRLCDDHFREHARACRPRPRCTSCGDWTDGKPGRSLCAGCRSQCNRCGEVKQGGACQPCLRDRARVAYRVGHGIVVDAQPTVSCRECSAVLVSAANHGVVSVARQYCSDTCRYRAKCRRRRVLRAGSEVERYAAADVFERDGWVCRLCDEPVDRDARWPAGRCATIDHVVPVSLGGADVSANVQTAHFACNISKGNRVAA